MTDANGNKASMSYDGFDRQSAWNFPSPTTPTPPAPLAPIFSGTCRSMQAMLMTAMTTGLQFEVLLPSETTCAGFSGTGGWSNKAISEYNLVH